MISKSSWKALLSMLLCLMSTAQGCAGNPSAAPSHLSPIVTATAIHTSNPTNTQVSSSPIITVP